MKSKEGKPAPASRVSTAKSAKSGKSSEGVSRVGNESVSGKTSARENKCDVKLTKVPLESGFCDHSGMFRRCRGS